MQTITAIRATPSIRAAERIITRVSVSSDRIFMDQTTKDSLPAVPEEKPNLMKATKDFFGNALSTVKGKDLTSLVEEFSSEMTLVAEGLCEDQRLLRREVDQIIAQDDRRIQALQSRIDATETMLEEERTAHDRDVTELRSRLATLEKKAGSRAEQEKSRKVRTLKGNQRTRVYCQLLEALS